MYSVLMVMALNASAAATPAWDGCAGSGCWGGCHGGYVSSCSGCWGGCSGSCHGGHKLFGGGLFHKNRCSGCWGGCSSSYGCSSSWGCSGGCTGHVVSYGCSSCSGSWGCSSSCHGGHKLFGGGLFHKNRCHGCNGCSWGGCHGGCYMSACSGYGGCTMSGCAGAPAQQQAPAPKAGGGEKPINAAEVNVSLPAEAKLFIDGQATVSTSNTRKFVSPELVAGKEYFYTLRAEIVRDGQTVSLTKEVTVRAGETIQASFDFTSAPVAAK